MKIQRVLLMVLDGFGIGALPDAADYGDLGSNTLQTLLQAGVNLPVLESLGLYQAAGMCCNSKQFSGSYGRQRERSKGKDTLVGHWEICGAVTQTAFPCFTVGFPPQMLQILEKAWGKAILGNRVASGTQIIQELGESHCRTGEPIVYTSADSVLQIATHEEVVPLDELYKWCAEARELLQGEWQVGRVVARPFAGLAGNYKRTHNRKDFCASAPNNILDLLSQANIPVTAIGKISNIFSGRSIAHTVHTQDNTDGLQRQLQEFRQMERGLVFTNLIDTDMLYGHRNDIAGYCKAMEEIDTAVGALINELRADDLLIITGDHGCDPGFPGSDHTREYTPVLLYNPWDPSPRGLGTLDSLGNIAATIAAAFQIPYSLVGQNLLCSLC